MFDIGNTESTSLAWLKVLLGGTFRQRRRLTWYHY